MIQEKEQLTYTVILHNIRKKLKLSLMEYSVADSIYHLSNNPKSKVKGWCWASKKNMADFLGVSQQTIFEHINKLIQKNIVEKDSATHYLRTTNKWYESVILVKDNAGRKETLSPINNGVDTLSRKFTHSYKETLHNNNIDNDKYKKTILVLKNWNESQSSPIRLFKPENIINKHGLEMIDKLIKEYGKRDNGFSQFLQALKNHD